ncbi:MAG: peptidoglycan-binding protein [Hyphomicrobium sp.]
MFTEELIAALQIMDRGDFSPSTMIGSWAGEIGQTQFLPTRYLDYAIDYDGDGRNQPVLQRRRRHRLDRELHEEPRLALERAVDRGGARDARPAVGEGRSRDQLPRSQWTQWGIQYPDGSPIPADNLTASLLLPMGRNGPAFLAYPNFGHLYGVEQLAELRDDRRLSGDAHRRRGGHVPRPRDTNGLDAAGTKELQQILARRGYDVGKIDGLAGAKTRAAVKGHAGQARAPG